MLHALEYAARRTGTADFGRRLAARQGIEILGSVGAAARSAPTLAEALATFERYLRAYSPAIQMRTVPLPEPRHAFFEFRIVLDRLAPHAQAIELALGVSLRVFRLLLGPEYSPVQGSPSARGAHTTRRVRALLRGHARVRRADRGIHCALGRPGPAAGAQ